MLLLSSSTFLAVYECLSLSNAEVVFVENNKLQKAQKQQNKHNVVTSSSLPGLDFGWEKGPNTHRSSRK